MKSMMTAALLTCLISVGTYSPKARAMEIAAIVVGGTVSTIALSGTAAVLGGARFKTQAYHDAMDAVSSGDESMLTPELKKMIAEVKQDNASVRDVEDLELLEAILNAEIIAE